MRKSTLRKTLALMLAFLAALTISLPASAAADYVVTISNTSLYSQASVISDRMAVLQSGEILARVAPGATWTTVEYNGYIGYVPTNAISVYLGNPSSNINVSAPIVAASTVQATGNVNVRSGPGTNYAALGKLKKGETLPCYSISDGWAEVDYMDGTAYISATYLKVVSGSGNVSSSSAQMEAIANVNVRSGPGTDYSKLGQLKVGDRVDNLGISNDWVKTTYNGKTAYISAVYLKNAASGNTGVDMGGNQNTTSSKTLYATRSAAVYSGPSTAYRAIAYLDYGDSINYVKDFNSIWYEVQFSVYTAYVLVRDFEFEKPKASSSVAGYYYVSVSSAPYYSAASSSLAYYLGAVSKNTRVYVLEQIGGWVKCIADNTYAYMLAEDLDLPAGIIGSGGTMYPSNEYMYASQANVPCYSTTSADARYRLGYLSRGERVYVYSANSIWAKCDIVGETMYVEVKYLLEYKP